MTIKSDKERYNKIKNRNKKKQCINITKCEFKCHASYKEGSGKIGNCKAGCYRKYAGESAGAAADTKNSSALRNTADVERPRQKARVQGSQRDDRAARRAREKLRKAAGKKVSVKKGKAKDIIRALSVKNLEGKQKYSNKKQQQKNNKTQRNPEVKTRRRRGYDIYYQPKLRF